jgi:ferredoxin-like protein FixX
VHPRLSQRRELRLRDRTAAVDFERFVVRGGTVATVPGGRFVAGKAHQIANFQDFCNECGNCDVFCPEDGGPYIEKPRLFGSLESWTALRDRDGFFARGTEDGHAIWARIRGREYRLEVDHGRDRGVFTDGVIVVEVSHRERRAVGASVRARRARGDTPWTSRPI